MKKVVFEDIYRKSVDDDGSWNVRERLVLWGQDSPEESIVSSVKVSVNWKSDT